MEEEEDLSWNVIIDKVKTERSLVNIYWHRVIHVPNKKKYYTPQMNVWKIQTSPISNVTSFF